MRHLSLLVIVLLSLSANAQLEWTTSHPGAIRYTLDLARVAQHELRITVDFPAVPTDVFTVRMPNSSPGRYAQHDFAKNVYDLTATGADGKVLVVYPAGLGTWQITGHGGAVRLTYTLFADRADGTYSGVDDRKLHLNMPATFLYGEQLNDRPILLVIPTAAERSPRTRPEWTVATQLVKVAGDRVRAAPNYAYFYDSPTFVGDITRDSFSVSNPGGLTQIIEVAMIHEGTRAEFDDYVDEIERVVLAEQKVFGELPRFDYGRYTFLCAYNPYVSSDGMEHRNSTVCSSTGSLAEDADRLIGTVAHEFFHSWNVERIRPASLEPFSFEHANMSGELWFAEGFTSYYDDLSLVRAGLLSVEDYAANLTDQLNYVLLSPGRAHRNPIEMSQQAPYVDAATALDPTNFVNTFVSYYSYGATIGLALDLALRERSHTLDEVMRVMWQRYGQPEIPYHIRDIELAVGTVTGDAAFAKTWFKEHIYGSQLPDFDKALAAYGLSLKPAVSDTVGFYRLSVREADGKVYVDAPVLENSPLYAAGLTEGCRILAIDGKAITSKSQGKAIIQELKIGRAVTIQYEQLGREKSGTFIAAASPEFRLSVDEKASKRVIEKRNGWLK